MQRKDIKIRSSEGGEFDCYLVMPDNGGKVPAMARALAILNGLRGEDGRQPLRKAS